MASIDQVPRPATARELALAREGLIASGELPRGDLVSPEIRKSWVRSLGQRVDADRVDPTYAAGLDHESLFAHCARQVLSATVATFATEAISLILTDARGQILYRWCAERGLEQRLDKVSLAPGFLYAEGEVGTNGIGTTLERRTPTLVVGGEHFASELAQFACAGAPVIHPTSGALLGAVDITARAGNGLGLMLSTARGIAEAIRRELLERSCRREVALMRDYLATCQHAGGSVLAIGDAFVMMNRHTRENYDAADQAALLAQTSDVTGSGKPATILGDLPSGQVARIDYRPTFADDELVGGIYRVLPTDVRDSTVIGQAPVRLTIPGVVGRSTTWQRVCDAVMECNRRGEPVVLQGELGVGKTRLASGVHQLRNPGGHLLILDGQDLDETASATNIGDWLERVEAELAEDGGTLIIRRAHLLAAEAVSGLASLLLEHSVNEGGPWIVLALAAEHDRSDIETLVQPHFPRTLDVPPLRRHLDDLPELVRHLLARVSREELRLSPEAMNQLRRLPWHGNVEQLRTVLQRIARNRRAGEVQITDLPPECHATTRRQLSPLEALQRDAIAEALSTHDGNKELAAEALGMSRATIYRRVREYGITTW